MNDLQGQERPGELRLYVVGESSGNPEEWCPYGGWSLVMASSPEEAGELGGWKPPLVAEVSPGAAMVIHRSPLLG